MTLTHQIYQDAAGRWHYVGNGRARSRNGRFLSAYAAAANARRRSAAVIQASERAARLARYELGALLQPPSAHASTVPTHESRQTERNRANRRRWARKQQTKAAELQARALRLFG